MNRTITTTLSLCVLALVAGCGDAFDAPTSPELSDGDETSAWSATQTSVIERMAKSMAKALANPVARESLYEEAAERFTGDTEALYTRLASKRIGGTPWENRLNVDARPEDTERLHFYVYGIEYSSLDHVPLVAVAVEDENAAVLTAFDAQGNEYELDAQIPPTQTVVVVALNERIDENGEPREFVDIRSVPHYLADAPGGGGGGGGGGRGPTGGSRVSPHAETMERIYLIHDNEPWFKGDPEIMMQMNVMAWPSLAAWRGSFRDVNDERRWYHVDRFLFNWYLDPEEEPDIDYSSAAAIMWWEEDGGDLVTVEVKYQWKEGREITFTFTLRDGDDQMGSVLINFADSLDTVYNTGDIKWEHN